MLPFRPSGAAGQKPVGSANAAEPVLKTPDPAPRPSPQQSPRAPVEQNSVPAAPTATPRPAPPKRTGVRAPGAPPLGLKDLSPVSSADWAAKVGEAAKMVDVIVVFYSGEYLDSEMFQVAFQTVVNEVLPQIGRPYTVYRFSLDAEPGFVTETWWLPTGTLGMLKLPLASVSAAYSEPSLLRTVIGQIFVGVDVGRNRDLTVVTAVERLGPLSLVRAVLRIENMRLPQQQERLAVGILALLAPEPRSATASAAGAREHSTSSASRELPTRVQA